RNDKALDGDEFTFLAKLVRDPASPILVSRRAAHALGHLRLTTTNLGQATELATLVATASPLQIAPLLRPFEILDPRDCPPGQLDSLGVQLAAALRKSPGRGSLRPDQAASLAAAFASSAPKAATALRTLTGPINTSGDREAKLSSLLGLVESGNASRGRVLFHANRATCALCHRVHGEGGALGPNLSKIGGIRSRKDLLEAIVFPSATVVNGFEAYLVTTTAGASHTGLVQRETAEAVYLRSTDQRLHRIPRKQISRMLRSPVSAMPEGLDGIFSDQELADLVAFL
ncbi:MAG: c-type cytochrome, partial [Akkermansiaceae bacterium]|nr:c-type cytochrome [Akkermansiaceae bacterium]